MKSAFRAPSNIALVKYWGKYGVQLPSNPSISFTLDSCATETTVELTDRPGISVELDGVDTPGFVPKIAQFVERIAPRHPWIGDYGIRVQTHNTFPHSSGIASSASGMSALALCVVDLAQKLGHAVGDPKQEASILARLGSGSACRSLYGGLVVWGETPSVPGSAQEFGTPYPHEVNEVFRSYRDVVALVDVGQKAVSSTAGHQLMEQHPFRTQRFAHGVHSIAEPFYLVCGYGETGGLVCAALDRAGLRVVVLEQDPARLAELDLQDFRAKPYGLVADVRSTDALRDAGLEHARLSGVLALTNDDEANLKVAIAVRLLNP
jgi:diphosphomevalonate decarboxylase